MSESKIENFTDLTAWQRAHEVVMSIYKITDGFPKKEIFGLSSQMQRSAISITSNIAEGFGRRTFRDKCHFYYQSRGSISELRNQLIIARDLSYISASEYASISEHVGHAHRLLQGLINKTNSFSNY